MKHYKMEKFKLDMKYSLKKPSEFRCLAKIKIAPGNK